MQMKPGKPVGLLNVNKETPKFSVSLHSPSADLTHFIEHYWVVPDIHIDLINTIIQCVISDRSIVKVDDIVSRFPIQMRQLQLLFRQYVGISPKWIIQRYRLHEAVEKMTNGHIPDWSRLALDLGYYDQAHFIKDFKSIIGNH